MKEFNRSKEGFFICEECNSSHKNKVELSKHINKFHDRKTYYDKWIKEENDGKLHSNYRQKIWLVADSVLDFD